MASADVAPTDEVELGSIVGVFGVTGEVRVHLYNRESFLLERRTKVWLQLPDGAVQPVWIRCRAGAGKRVLARLTGPKSREDAHAMIGARILVDRSALPSLDDGEYYVYQLVGMRVRCDGKDVGTIAEVHNTDGGDILEIDVPGGPAYVALSHDVVVDVNQGFCEVPADALEEL